MMPDVTFETCETEDLIGGEVVTTNVDAAAAVYYRGQALGMITTTAIYGNLDLGATNGNENASAIVAADHDLSGGAGRLQVFTSGSKIQKRGIKDGAGDQLTVDQALIENFRINGNIVIKN